MKRFPSAMLATFAAAIVVAGCGGSSDSSEGGSAGSDSSKGSINLVAYSTPEVVYQEIIPDFNKTSQGEGIGFKSSYGASGDQSRAVEAGQAADFVSFSTEPDMTRLVDAGLVDANWQDNDTNGQITNSVVSFVVRKGNPKDIKTWADLIKPGVEVLTPNPFTSGAAKWNLLAAYGANGGIEDPKKGLDYLKTLLNENVVAQDKSGRDALQNFTSGTGDVLLSYEYEATTAQKKGQDVDYVIPDDTIKIDIDFATTKEASQPAKDFYEYVTSKPAQERFASWGYRPVNEEVLEANADKFPTPKGLFTIDDFGGWEKANPLFDLEENGEIAKIVEGTGVPTSD